MPLIKMNQFIDTLSPIDCLQSFKKETLQQFEKQFNLAHSIFWLCNEDYTVHSPTKHQIDENMFQQYTEYYYEQDVLLPINLIKKKGRHKYTSMIDIISKQEYEKTVYYNDFMKPQQFQNEFGMYLYNRHNLIGGISFAVHNYELGTSEKERKAFHLLSHFIALMLQKMQHTNRHVHLVMSKAERSVFERLLLGEKDGEIAKALHLSIHTVKKHLRNLYEKNGVSNRTSLIAKANQED